MMPQNVKTSPSPQRAAAGRTGRRTLGAAALLLLVAAAQGQAQTDLTWAAAGPTDNWSTDPADANWTGGSAWIDGSNAILNGETLNVDGSVLVNNITITATTTVGDTGTPGTLSLSTGSVVSVTHGGTSSAINEAIVAGSLTKTGTGVLALGGQSTFDGGVTLSAGQLVPTASSISTSGTLVSGPLGTGTLTINGGQMRSTSNSPTTVHNPVVLGGNFTQTTVSNSKVLTFAGPVTLTGNRTISQEGTSMTISGSIGDGGGNFGLTKSGTNGGGTLTLSGGGTYTGTTRVTAGTLVVSGALTGTSRLILSGGTLRLGAANRVNDAAVIEAEGGTLDLAGFSETVGQLKLDGGASIFNLGAGASILNFAASDTQTWAGTLQIQNWSGSVAGGGTDQIFIGTNAAGLTGDQLAAVTFLDPVGFSPGTYGAQLLSTGELVAVPEPASALLAATGALLLLRRRRAA